MKVKIDDRVVCTPHSEPAGRGTVLEVRPIVDGWTGKPRPPHVVVLLDPDRKGKRVQQTFPMKDIEKEKR